MKIQFMPIIKRSYHQSNIYLSPSIVQGKAMCGQTVVTLNVLGERSIVHFAGFKTIASFDAKNRCVLTEITAFTPEDDVFWGKYRHYHRNDWLLGYSDKHGAKLVLMEDGYPLVVNACNPSFEGSTPPRKQNKNNVHQLHLLK